MPVLLYFLAFATLVFAVLTVVMRRKGRSFDGMIFKFLSSFAFMSISIVGYGYNTGIDHYYFCLVVFGLMFGLEGDVLLGIKEIAPKFKMKLIAMGTLSFLIGHIFFLSAFLRISSFSFIPLIFAVAVAAISAVIMKVLKFKINAPMAALAGVYYAFLWYKAAVALQLYIQTGTLASLLGLIARALFIISDTCLAFLYFTPTKSKNRLVAVELSTYYIAQTLFALTIAVY